MLAIPIELETHLNTLAEAEKITPASLISKMLDNYLVCLEDAMLVRMADDVIALNEPSLSAEDAMRMLDDMVN